LTPTLTVEQYIFEYKAFSTKPKIGGSGTLAITVERYKAFSTSTAHLAQGSRITTKRLHSYTQYNVSKAQYNVTISTMSLKRSLSKAAAARPLRSRSCPCRAQACSPTRARERTHTRTHARTHSGGIHEVEPPREKTSGAWDLR